MNQNVGAYMLLDEEFLRDARLLFAAGDYRSAASRAYYSFYDAVRGKSIVSKSHQAARVLFSEQFINNGPFTGQDSKDFHALSNLRQNSDYDPDESLGVEEVEKAVETAAEFLLQAEAYLRENNFGS